MNSDKAREMRDEQKAADAVNAVRKWRVRHAWIDAIRYADIEVDAATKDEAIDAAWRAVDEEPTLYWDTETYDDSCGPTFVDSIEDIDAGEDTTDNDIPISERESAKSNEHGPKVVVCSDGDKPRTISLAAAMIELSGPIERCGLTGEMLKRLAAGEYFHFVPPTMMPTHTLIPAFWLCMANTKPVARDYAHGLDIVADQGGY